MKCLRFLFPIVSRTFFLAPPCRSLVLKHRHKFLSLLARPRKRISLSIFCLKRARPDGQDKNSPTHQPAILRASHSRDGPFLFFGFPTVPSMRNGPPIFMVPVGVFPGLTNLIWVSVFHQETGRAKKNIQKSIFAGSPPVKTDDTDSPPIKISVFVYYTVLFSISSSPALSSFLLFAFSLIWTRFGIRSPSLWACLG